MNRVDQLAIQHFRDRRIAHRRYVQQGREARGVGILAVEVEQCGAHSREIARRLVSADPYIGGASDVPAQVLERGVLHLPGQAFQDRAVLIEIEKGQVAGCRELDALSLGAAGLQDVGATDQVGVDGVQRHAKPEVVLVLFVVQVLAHVAEGEREPAALDANEHQRALGHLLQLCGQAEIARPPDRPRVRVEDVQDRSLR